MTARSKKVSIIDRLKTLNLERLDADEAIADYVSAKGLIAGFGEFGVAPPTWLSDVSKNLGDEIRRRHRDMQVARLRELEAQETALLSRDEKRAAIKAEAEKLRAQLSGGTMSVAELMASRLA